MGSGVHSASIRSTDESAVPMVYVVDDDESIRIALKGLLNSVGLRVQTFASSEDFLTLPKNDVPSCLILDVRLRGKSGLTLQTELANHDIRMPVLFMTAHGDIAMTVKAMKAGAFDFFAKPFKEQDMLDAVAHALARDKARLAAEQSLAALRSCYNSLTPREQDVMNFVVAGMMNKEIATQMGLSEVTVKVHRGHVMKKMAALSVADLVRKAEILGVGLDQCDWSKR
jgi:FixJ family two-component response regulator